jgi:methyl-accepting chemotaxis protein
MKRSLDGKLYKFVGVSRSDKPGIIQVAFNAESIQAITLQVGGFKVVANEVYLLAEKAKSSAKSIEELIIKLQQSILEIDSAMEQSREEVVNGLTSANHSGEVLKSILASIDLVTQQAIEASDAAQKMTLFANELVSAVDTVSAVVEENTAATEQMSAGASEVTNAIENIASVSEENSAAIEEVSAATQEITNQIDEFSNSSFRLAELAENLINIVQKFKLV